MRAVLRRECGCTELAEPEAHVGRGSASHRVTSERSADGGWWSPSKSRAASSSQPTQSPRRIVAVRSTSRKPAMPSTRVSANKSSGLCDESG
jgi:hypothetical protein